MPYVALWVLAYYALAYSVWLLLPIWILAAGFMVRIFIIFHDCGHGSFFRSNSANQFWGVLTGVLTFTPFHYWRASHARHHATSANLDKRGEGDVWMMTVKEYLESPRKTRIQYRLYRNPLVMFFLGPLFITIITNRFVRHKATTKERWSVYGTNIGILVVALLMSLLVGFKAYLLIQLPVLFVAQVAGIWLFYVQHQFDGVYWSRQSHWDFLTASLEGGSYYKLPRILQWFTGNIGYHHIHHLDSRIPNYRLPKVQKELPEVQSAPTLGLFTSFRSLRYRLWDEKQQKMVGFGGVEKRVEQVS